MGVVTDGVAPLVPDAGRGELRGAGRRRPGERARGRQRRAARHDRLHPSLRARGGRRRARRWRATCSAGLDRVAVLLAAELTGVAQRAMEMATEYAREREQFGRPIGAYQAVAHRCAEMLLETESARATMLFAAYAADHEPESLPLAAATAKSCAVGRGLEGHGLLAPGARRHRLHVGARPALLPQAGEGRCAPVRKRRRAPRAGGRPARVVPHQASWPRSHRATRRVACAVRYTVIHNPARRVFDAASRRWERYVPGHSRPDR